MNDNNINNIKTCPVCEAKIKLDTDSHYIARDDTGTGFAMLAGGQEPQLWDAVDCPECGCQVILGKRKRPILVKPTSIVEDTVTEAKTDDDTENGTIRETITTTREELKMIVAEAIREAMLENQVAALGTTRKGWIDVGRVFKAACSHGRKVSLGYVGTMCEQARQYCENNSVSVKAFEDKWVDYLNNPESTIYDAYGMARLRTRGGKK